MADYIYLLENRLSADQKKALETTRSVARAKGLTIFLVGGAVRDLTSGSPVRDLDVVLQGNALKLRKDFEAAGAVVTGTHDALQSLYVRLPGGVRMEIGSTMTASYPKPGKAVLKPSTILDDLRRRDFTANAMALSLNDGSYGLLMDPLNGVADIENRELRLASNYGFIEDPVRMIRAARFAARLGWTLEEKTQARYETGKQEGYISTMQDVSRGYEAEEIVHEEDPLRVMRRLEAEGWMQVLAPSWNSAKANVTELEKVRESQTQLQMQGIHPDPAAVNFPLLTAKMAAKEIEGLKKSFPRQGFVQEIEGLEAEAKEFTTLLNNKAATTPSVAYRAITSARPEVVLYVAYATKSPALQAKLKSFFTDWPQARTKIPFALMQEMRIVPELPGYTELVEKLFFELMNGNLSTVEEMRAYLEPYSPPAPPPPVHLRRPRAAKKDAKKGRTKKGASLVADDEDGDDGDGDDEEEDRGTLADDDEDADTEGEENGEVAELSGDRSEQEAVDEEDEDDEEEATPVRASRAPAKKTAPVAKAVEIEAEVVPLASAAVPSAEEMRGESKVRSTAKSHQAPGAPVSKTKAAPQVGAKSVSSGTVEVKAVSAKAVAAKTAVKATTPAKAAAKSAAPSMKKGR